MKTLLLLFFTIISAELYAQQINGQILDAITKLPLENTLVGYGLQSTYTGTDGTFKLPVMGILGSIKIHKLGYESIELSLIKILPNMKIYLQPVSLALDDIVIMAKRNYLADSLKLRKEYANVFGYKAPTIKDVFVEKGLRYKQFGSSLVSNSTSSIISLDILKTIGFLTKNKSSISKLQKLQLKDEDKKYINYRFNAKKIADITGLTNDSLAVFIDRYRPSSEDVKKMNDYEILIYVKKSYTDFVKSNKP